MRLLVSINGRENVAGKGRKKRAEMDSKSRPPRDKPKMTLASAKRQVKNEWPSLWEVKQWNWESK